MVDHSEIRCLSPFVSFFIARLRVFLGSLGSCRPLIEDFISRDSALSPVLVNLCPLLHQSLNWFQSLREMSMEERVGSKVRSSELEMGLSSSDDTIGVKTDTTTSVPLSSQPSPSRPIRPFHALKEEYSLNKNTLSRFRDRFQFPDEIK